MTGVWKEGRIFDFVEHMTRQQRNWNWTWTWTCTKNSLIDEAMLSAAVAEGVSAKEWRLLLSFVVAALLLSMIVSSFEFEESITGVALFAVVVGDRDRDREQSSSSNKATFCDDGGCCKSVASDEVDDESAQQSATVLGP